MLTTTSLDKQSHGTSLNLPLGLSWHAAVLHGCDGALHAQACPLSLGSLHV